MLAHEPRLTTLRRFIFRTIRAVKLLARDKKIPRPLRWLALLGLLPVPGPFDEAVLLLVGALVWAFYRDRMRAAWLAADRNDVSSDGV
jgi:hypothetical protein